MQAQTRVREFTWVDVRSAERFEKAHIPGAVSFDEADFSEGLERIKGFRMGGKKIVVYGEGTGSERALRVARLLKKELQTKDIALLEGGWAAWPRE